jgi:hypothetical protein
MPLRDHFRPPLHPTHKWEGVHGGWPMVIIQKLLPSLPDGYFAEPRVHLGSFFEVDIGTFERLDPENGLPPAGDGSVALAPESLLTLEVDLSDPSEYEVLIYDAAEGRRLVAAVEIVPPANKDRLEHRRAFVTKCAALLQQQVCVVIVDIVTIRQSNLYLELLEHVGRSDPRLGKSAPGTYAASCRSRRGGEKSFLQIDRHELRLDQPLPTLPLWLAEDLSIPLNLEQSYEATCQALRIN